MRKAIFALPIALLAFAVWQFISLTRVPLPVRAALRDLHDPSDRVRREAASRIEQLGPRAKGAQQDLIAALNDPDPNGMVHNNVAKALVAIGPDPEIAIPALVNLMETNPAAAESAAYCLANIPGGNEALIAFARANQSVDVALALASKGEACLPQIETLFADASRNARATAVVAAGRIGPAGVPVLVKALSDADTDIRCTAAACLSEKSEASPVAVPALTAALGDSDPRARTWIAGALLSIDPSSKARALETLTALMNNSDPSIRSGVIHQFRNSRADGLSFYISGLNDNDPDVQSSALSSLTMLGPEAALAMPALIARLDAPATDTLVKQQILELVAVIGPDAKAALPSIRKALKNPELAGPAIQALAGLGAEAGAAVPDILAALKRDPKSMGSTAAVTLGSIGPAAKDATPALLELLASEDSDTCREAATALGKIGVATDEIVDRLIELLIPIFNDSTIGPAGPPARDVVAAAAEALGKLGPTAKRAAPNLLALATSWNEPSNNIFAAALALIELDPTQGKAVAKLLTVNTSFTDEDQFARTKAALTKLGADADGVIQDIHESFFDVDLATQTRMVDLIVQMAPNCPSAVPALTACLQCREPSNRELAAKTLGELGPRAIGSIDALKGLEGDLNQQVREAAAQAISRIQPNAEK